LRGTGPLDEQARAKLREIDRRRPSLFEVPWIRLQRQVQRASTDGSTDTDSDDWLLEARARHAVWGVPWLKGPFDSNPDYEALIGPTAVKQA